MDTETWAIADQASQESRGEYHVLKHWKIGVADELDSGLPS